MPGDHRGEDSDREQFALIPALAAAKRVARSSAATTLARDKVRPVFEPAAQLPVAQVLVDVPLAHLDRPFDYLVPAREHDRAVPGARVKVRFAGQDVDGFLLARTPGSAHPGRLAPLRRVVSAEPVLTTEVAELVEAVAHRYAGTRSDVLRLAVPPRHATVEKQPSVPAPPPAADLDAAGRWWHPYDGGSALVRALAAGAPARTVWTAMPGADWPTGFAHAAAATLAGGRGAVLCVPDRRDLDRLDAALGRVLGAGQHVLLTAELGAAERYRSFLALRRGAVKVVAGTRAAAFAPVRELGMVAIWDDGDDLFAEPRAPYPHCREVLLLRSHQSGCAALLGGFARTAEAAGLVSTGWAREVVAPRPVLRERSPRVSVTGATDAEMARDPFTATARLPHLAHAAIRSALVRGPVLVSAPRSGYAELLVCNRCRAAARCSACSGPLRLPGPRRDPVCRWCGAAAVGHSCASCGAGKLRAPVLGARRTVEELGRAFPGVPVRRSSGDRVLTAVGDEPAIVVATPGAEPPADRGYAAAVLLDSELMLARPGLRTTEEAVRRWFNAAALVRPVGEGGQVVVVGDPGHPALQALVRWDPAGFARREHEERAAAHLPPVSRIAVLTGPAAEVNDAASALRLPPGAQVLGPASTGDADEERSRLIVRVPRRSSAALSEALRELQGVRSAKKLPSVRVQVDPYDLS